MDRGYVIRDWSPVLNAKLEDFPESACPGAKIGMYTDLTSVRDSIFFWRKEFHLYDTTLKPWKPG